MRPYVARAGEIHGYTMRCANTTKYGRQPPIVVRPSSFVLRRNALFGGCRRRLLGWRGGWLRGVVGLDQATILLGLGVLVGQQLLERLPALLLNLLRDLRLDLLLGLLLGHRRAFAAADQLDDMVAKLGLHRLFGGLAGLEILEHGFVKFGHELTLRDILVDTALIL